MGVAGSEDIGSADGQEGRGIEFLERCGLQHNLSLNHLHRPPLTGIGVH